MTQFLYNSSTGLYYFDKLYQIWLILNKLISQIFIENVDLYTKQYINLSLYRELYSLHILKLWSVFHSFLFSSLSSNLLLSMCNIKIYN